jgi:anti-sigma factor RsiW
MAHSAHLNDDRLFDCYLSARSGDTVDPRVADHLAGCMECGARYDAFVEMMDGIRAEADAEVDELFPAARLHEQQQQILHRLEHVHRSARVISFPGRRAAGTAHATGRVAPRWLAAAAAAGLFIGVAVGGFLTPDRFHRTSAASSPIVTAPVSVKSGSGTPAVRVNSTTSEQPDDDAFLMELELALARPHTRELLPLDAMTPHVRDVRELTTRHDIVMDVK